MRDPSGALSPTGLSLVPRDGGRPLPQPRGRGWRFLNNRACKQPLPRSLGEGSPRAVRNERRRRRGRGPPGVAGSGHHPFTLSPFHSFTLSLFHPFTFVQSLAKRSRACILSPARAERASAVDRTLNRCVTMLIGVP